MNRTPFKKNVAVLLSVSLLWIFAACILLCGDSVCAEKSFNHVTVIANDEAPASDSCPIAETAEAAKSEQIGLPLIAIAAVVSRQIFDFKLKPVSPNFRFSFQEFVFARPPLERLPALRI